MADYDIRPLQLRILKILLAVDKVCKEHGLRYYIMAGTMLGAVRHKGFIGARVKTCVFVCYFLL